MEIKPGQSGSALAIVAHPDDETIFMGGAISRYKDLDWTIFSLCRAGDPDRAPKFKKVCRHYSATPLISDLEDEGRLSVAGSIPVITGLIRKKIGKKRFDLLFTHGMNGEYGHPRHLGVHQAVKAMLSSKSLKADNAFFFHYKKSSRREFAGFIPRKNADLIINLNKEQFGSKKSVMTEIYGFDPNGIDANYCTNPEAYKKYK